MDLSHLLDIQAGSANGTYVSNNPVLCILPPILWAGQSNSLISYAYGQVCDDLVFCDDDDDDDDDDD